MLARNFYYILKPYLPWHVRIALRRIVARRKRTKSGAIWPINEAAGHPPAGWPGWPEGKKFAVVLAHDVEGPDGLARCMELAKLELELGFRSSFNFIPEGQYQVTPELRAWLTDRGFEVGVHDLNHDGHLYSSPQGFMKKARRINQYLREWGAAGFRAGFMLRNLHWVHQLDIQYDASTFDTDPFEPQPDAAGTIFPFWIKTPTGTNGTAGTPTAPPFPTTSRGGYCELPYTLPQDSTLFMLLQERTNEIWRKKLDWVAGRGGMVLLNVHPDYLPIQGDARSSPLTVRDHYIDLLKYLSKTYGQSYWHVLPRDMAAFVLGTKDRATPTN